MTNNNVNGIQMPVLILGVGKPYRIEGKNGEPDTEGCSMFYLNKPDVNETVFDPTTGEIGLLPAKQSMPIGFYDVALKRGLPCQAFGTFGMKTSSGKFVLVLKEIAFDEGSEGVGVIEEVLDPAQDVIADDPAAKKSKK